MGADPIRIAVIGGTGINALTHHGFTHVAELLVDTPWGSPSSPIQVLAPVGGGGEAIAFLSRHGPHHELTPSEVPSRANLAALRSLGVRSVLAFSAVGSLQAHILRRDFVLPDQIIDRTKGVRPSTFFDDGIVAHVGFADPFDDGLLRVVARAATGILDKEGGERRGDMPRLQVGGVLVCMEGPAFSTRAESALYRSWGGSVINMSALPEAKLAREAEMAYAMVCMTTDFDCWKTDEPPVGVASVISTMHRNAEIAERLTVAVVRELSDPAHRPVVHAEHLAGSTKAAICTATLGLKPAAVERIHFLFPGFFD